MNNLIVPLDLKKKSAVNVRLLGGKAANLLKLNQYGFQTAPGFIITTNVFHRFINQSGKSELLSLTKSGSEAYKYYQESLSAFQFDSKVEKKINFYFKKLTGPVAVRSSMVEEDQADASFAGQLDTYLNVRQSELISSIKMCYASVLNPQLHHYISGRKKSLKSQDAPSMAMAVIVQQMVKAQYSGIVFTADPICGRREVIIEASTGTGEDLAEGKINPDRYVVSANGQIAEMTPVVKDQPLLSSDQILQLAESALQIAHHMAFPQDIEWAWDGKGFIYLQTRPISNLAGKNIYSSKLMADMSPGLVKPLQWSTNTLAMSTNVFGRLFTEIIGPNDIDFSQSIRLIHSRVYANITFYEELFRRIGLPVNFFEMIHRDENGRGHKPKFTFRLLYLLVFRLFPFILKYAHIRKQMKEFVAKQDVLLDKYRKTDWTLVSIDQKFEQFRDLMQLHNDAQWSIILTGLNMTIRNTLVKKMVRKHAATVEPSNLIKGISGLKGLEPNRELMQLSDRVRQLGDHIVHLCLEEDDRKIRTELSSSDMGKQLLARFDAFMRKFGHLSANTTNFTETPWIENPALIWSLIGRGALKEKKLNEENHESIRETNKNKVLQQLVFLQRPVFRHLLNSTISYLSLREKLSLLLSEDTHQFRRLSLSIGADLVNRGQLEQNDDVFYLFFNELESLLHSAPNNLDVREKIKNRREAIINDDQIVTEDTICGNQIIIHRHMKIDNSEYLSGICGSSGFKQGYAYVVDNPAKVNKVLTEEDILVVPFTHVGWTPLFSTIGGIIAEAGGQLSHTSIVAREYGIPAIVGVRRAMQSIKTGQPLTVDADSGRIYLNHVASMKGD